METGAGDTGLHGFPWMMTGLFKASERKAG
jgi:hypothetical protein